MQHNKKNIIWPNNRFTNGQIVWQSNEFGDCWQDHDHVYGLYFEKHRPKFKQIKDEHGKTRYSVKVKGGYWRCIIIYKMPKTVLRNSDRTIKIVQGHRRSVRKLSYESRLEALSLYINDKFDECRRFLEHTLWLTIPKQISPTTLRFIIDDLS